MRDCERRDWICREGAAVWEPRSRALGAGAAPGPSEALATAQGGILPSETLLLDPSPPPHFLNKITVKALRPPLRLKNQNARTQRSP